MTLGTPEPFLEKRSQIPGELAALALEPCLELGGGRDRQPLAAPLREELACSHAGGHLVGLGAVGAAVLELDHGQPLLAA